MSFRRLLLSLVVLVGLCVSHAPAQELHSLTTPQSVTVSSYTLTSMFLDVANNRIVIVLTSNTGVVVQKTYDASTSPTGATLLHNLNTANFTVNSLVKAVYARVVSDGVIPAGSVIGTPQ
jgi:hypothetical protein